MNEVNGVKLAKANHANARMNLHSIHLPINEEIERMINVIVNGLLASFSRLLSKLPSELTSFLPCVDKEELSDDGARGQLSITRAVRVEHLGGNQESGSNLLDSSRLVHGIDKEGQNRRTHTGDVYGDGIQIKFELHLTTCTLHFDCIVILRL